MSDVMAAPLASGFVGRARRASLSVINVNPQLGMWQAAGTAIAQAPNLTELRDVELGGENISFNAQGHSARVAAVHQHTGELSLVKKSATWANAIDSGFSVGPEPAAALSSTSGEDQPKDHDHHHHDHHLHHHHRQLFHRSRKEHEKANWGPTIKHGLQAFWRFLLTPSGFLITIYFLNIVAWGAMLFFLLLKAAPAMNHPSADDNSSPRKKWLEVDSQILNALFCVTAFGLAPWRFRDLYLFIRAAHFKDLVSMLKLAEQNKSWFRPPAWARQGEEVMTFTGQAAPSTPLWKLGFTIWMMVLNTLLQAVLCFFMWHYNRIERPSWATGTFIGLGCGVAMSAGLVSWWEGRKVKKIEGPEVKILA